MKKQEIEEAKPKQVIWDDVVKGLHLRVTPNGHKSYCVYYRNKLGIQRRPKIGGDDISIADARRRAKAILDQVATGADPSGDWKLAKAEATLSEFFPMVLKEYWGHKRYERSGYVRDVKQHWKNHLEPEFGNQRLSQIRISDVRSWHKRYAATPQLGNRALSVLSKIFTYAESEEILPMGANPCRLVKRYKEKKRSRYATVDEIKQLLPILNREEADHPNGVAFLWVLLFTGARPISLERATWDDLEIIKENGTRYGVLRFDGKSTSSTGEEEKVILPERALLAIEKLPRRLNNLLLNSKMPHKLWRKIRAEIGCNDLWARDFRRTFATIGMSGGINSGLIGELLNHHSADTTKIYAKLNDDARVTAVMQIANEFEKIMLA